MGRFDRLKQLSVNDKTMRFELPEAHVPEYCKEPPVLLLRHAGQANRDWMNLILSESVAGMAEATEAAAESGKSKKEAAHEFATVRAKGIYRDRDLLARGILAGWENLYRDDGSLEEFSEEAGRELICGKSDDGNYLLPQDVFARIMEAAASLSNFRERPSVDPALLEAALGNSASD